MVRFLPRSLRLELFSVGYTTMSRHITNAGAFYAYIANGLGRPMGIGGGLIALLPVYAVLAAMICYLCGMRHREFSGRL